MTPLKVTLPVPATGVALPGNLPEKVLVDRGTGELIVRCKLSSADFACLRSIAPADIRWQSRIDSLVLEIDESSGLFPPSLWGDHLQRLQAGDAEAWSLFVRRYEPAITASIRNLLRDAPPFEVDDLTAEFISWLYLPPRNGVRAGQRLKGLQLMDETGRRVHRFRGWLGKALRRWVRQYARRWPLHAELTSRLNEIVSDAGSPHGATGQQIDCALLLHAADVARAELRNTDSTLHRALMDLLRNEPLSATTEWLRDAQRAASPQSAMRTRQRAAAHFRKRLIDIYQSRFGGEEADLLDHLEALAAHLASPQLTSAELGQRPARQASRWR